MLILEGATRNIAADIVRHWVHASAHTGAPVRKVIGKAGADMASSPTSAGLISKDQALDFD